MRFITLIAILSTTLFGLQGCNSATTGSNTMTQGSTVPSSDYMNRETVMSPAARISGGSGAMHQGMSNPPH